MTLKNPQAAVAIAFDGVICDSSPFDQLWELRPTRTAIRLLKALRSANVRVILFSRRARSREGRADLIRWVVAQGLEELIHDVTALKPFCLGFIEPEALSGDITEIIDEIKIRREISAQKQRGEIRH